MKTITGSLVLYKTQWEDLTTTADSFFSSAPGAALHVWDNSPDATLGDKLREKYGSRVSYCHSPKNVGYGAGHNQNFKNSQGNYFCILNPDIEMPVSTLETLTQFAEQNPRIGLVSCLIKNVDGSAQEVHKLMPSFRNYFVSTVQRLLRLPDNRSEWPLMQCGEISYYPMMSGCFMLFTREHFEELQGFDERFFLYFEDYDLSLRSFLLEKSAVIHHATIVHKWQRASHRHWKSFLIHVLSGLKFFNKWGFSQKASDRINNTARRRNL